jgi:nicotinamidase-related amidase
MSILTIVDMQESFLEYDTVMTRNETNSLIDNVINLVHAFKKRCLPIIVLQYNLEHGFDLYNPEERKEYKLWSSTVPEIMNAIGTYDKLHIKWKNTDSGARQVKTVVNKNNYNGTVYLCGVNASACVMETWFGLTKKGKKIPTKAVIEATRNVYDDDIVQNYIKDVEKLDTVVKNINA